MTEIDTSPAALRALAEYWADDKPAGVHGDDPDAIDAIVRETDAKMAETIAALLALAAEKEAVDSERASGRRRALEEAAVIADTYDDWCKNWGEYRNLAVAQKAAVEIAKAIRAAAEKEAGAPAQGPLTEVGETSRGYKLYRAPNPVGGSTYWSDEIGGGVVVWDTCLVGEETLRLALAIETGAPAPDGWIPWEGGECPVRPMDDVEVQYRDGSIDPAYPASAYTWHHHGGADDIIAYRLSKEG